MSKYQCSSCQHDDPLINFGLVSVWCSTWKSLPELRVGDRLEFRDTAQHHTHWGIYSGGPLDKVAHFASANRNENSFQGKCGRSSSGSSVGDKPVLFNSCLLDVDGKYEVRVNNERDQSFQPSSQADIADEINRILPENRGRPTRMITFTNSKDFVNYCRYDDLRINFGLVSDWCCSTKSLSELRLGDRLEFKRPGYAHWGIYVGNLEDKHHQVVHFTLADGDGKKFSKKKTSHSESSVEVKPTLCLNSIEDILQNDQVRINNERDERHPPFFGSHILGEIKRQLESQSSGYVPEYNLFSNNCEHFVNHCRYNTNQSDQVNPLRKTWNKFVKKPSSSVDYEVVAPPPFSHASEYRGGSWQPGIRERALQLFGRRS